MPKGWDGWTGGCRSIRGFIAAWRGWSADCRGAVAVEFGLVSIPFFLLLFAIIEVSLQFFVGEILDTATATAARLIRTGEAYKAGMTASQFKAKICERMLNLVDCDTYLSVDVRYYSQFSDYTPTSPLDSDGNVTGVQFQGTGAPWTKQIAIVRSFYAWPVYFNLLPHTSVRTAGGRELLSSVVAFRTESFPNN
jgi:Flp pilus assembly protein TadG